MSIDIGCINSTSALRWPLPIADALPYAARTGLLGLCIVAELRLEASPSRIDAISAADSTTGRRHRAHPRPTESP